MDTLIELGKLGLAGVSISLIVLIGYIIKLVFTYIRDNTDAVRELKDVVRELKTYLVKKNGN